MLGFYFKRHFVDNNLFEMRISSQISELQMRTSLELDFIIELIAGYGEWARLARTQVSMFNVLYTRVLAFNA